jgi:hypothetical protein
MRQMLDYDKEYGAFVGRMHVFFACKTAKIKKCEEVRFLPPLSPHQGLIPPIFAFKKMQNGAILDEFVKIITIFRAVGG